MPYDVFISYASKDKIAADAVCARLEVAGIRCWIAPRDIVPGTSYGEAIIVAIHEVKVMVLVFSSNANSSGHIPKEVERAVSKGLAIIPFRIEDVAPGKSLDYFIGSVHWLDAMSPPMEKHLDNLATTVQKLLPVKAGEQGVPSASGSGVWQRSAPPAPPSAVPPIAPVAPVPAVRPVASGEAARASSSKTIWIGVGVAAALALIVMGGMLVRGRGNSQNATNPPAGVPNGPSPASSPSPSPASNPSPVSSPSPASNPSPASSPSPASNPSPARNPYPSRKSDAPSPSPVLNAGSDPILGCYQWFNNAPVVIRPNHSVVAGPFTASWKVVNASDRTYLLTWPEQATESVAVSPDQSSVSGADQYGARDSGTRMSGNGGLVGIWNWSGLVRGLLTVRPDGTFAAGPASGPWSGTWQSAGGSNYRLIASGLPKDTLTLSADHSRLSGTDNYNIAISGVRTEPCAVN